MSASLTGDILVAYDRTDASRWAAAFAADRAGKTGESVDIVHVGTDVPTSRIRDAVDGAFDRQGVEYAVETISAEGAEHDNVAVSRELVSFVRNNAYELLVMGNESHDRIHAMTQASVSSNLIEARTIPVALVAKTTAVGPDVERSDRLLVPYDDSSPAEDAAEFAAERAAKTGEAVDVVHVGSGVSTRAMRNAVGDTYASHDVDVRFETVSASGSDRENVSVRKRLSDHIDDNEYRLVCMGNEERGLLSSMLHTSVSGALIENRSIPVVLVA